jgi:AcrR family transcriptional regulator
LSKLGSIDSKAPEDEGASSGRRDRTRRALIEAGERVLARSSLTAAAVDEIVAEAKVAKGTFYNHFQDKDALFAAIVAWVRGEVRALILSQTRDVEDPARKMARGFCVGLRYQLENQSRVSYLTRSWFVPDSVQDPLNEGVVGFVSEGIASGRFHLATTEAGVLLIHGLSGAAYAQTIHDCKPFPTIARAQQLAAILLRGLGLSIAEADVIAAQEADLVLRPFFSRSKC